MQKNKRRIGRTSKRNKKDNDEERNKNEGKYPRKTRMIG